MVRNKGDKFHERELQHNSREVKLPEGHITSVSFEKLSRRPPIYRTDHSPNPKRFEPFNFIPDPCTKSHHAAEVKFKRTCGRTGELFYTSPY